jgi:exodeoxyribonuclease-3
MRLATWNVNSIRARVERVIAFLDRHDVDVLAMQETKCKDEQFPFAAFEAAGYEVAHWGLSQWNGVAVASRIGLDDVTRGFPGQPGFAKTPTRSVDAPAAPVSGLFDDEPSDPPIEARAIGATCGGVRVWSLYVPNGRALGDPHYAYKLNWLAALRAAVESWIAAEPSPQLALMGDWNVAPMDTDVWDIAAFAGATHVSPPERAAFAAFEAAGLSEVTREHLPQPGTYTYWDYKGLGFAMNKGMRIDFAYASRALADRVTSSSIDRDERRGKGASDHAPVLFETVSEAE